MQRRLDSHTAIFKHRNVVVVPILFIVTLGIYGLYWFYSTSSELMRYNRREGNPLAWMLIATLPVVNVFAIWWQAQEVEKLSKEEGDEGLGATFVFVLWLAPPLAMMFIQAELNTKSAGKSRPSSRRRLSG